MRTDFQQRPYSRRTSRTRCLPWRHPQSGSSRLTVMLFVLLAVWGLLASLALAGPTGWSRSDPPRYAEQLATPPAALRTPVGGIASAPIGAADEAEMLHMAPWSGELVSGIEVSTLAPSAAGAAPAQPTGVLAAAEAWPSPPRVVDAGPGHIDEEALLGGEGATLVPLPPSVWAALATLAVLTVMRMGRHGGRRVPV